MAVFGPLCCMRDNIRHHIAGHRAGEHDIIRLNYKHRLDCIRHHHTFGKTGER